MINIALQYTRNQLRRNFVVAILVMVCLANSSCLSYRLNYVAQLEIKSEHDSDPSQAKKSREGKRSPTSALSVNDVYVYKYGANYSTGLLPLGCAVTVWVYGGLCWFYLVTPFDDDQLDIQDHANANLQTLLAGRDYRIRKIEYERVKRARDQPYYLLIDRDGSTIARGNAPARCSVDDTSACTPESSEKVEQARYTFRAAKLSRHLGSAMAKSTIVDAEGQRQVVAKGVAGYTQTSVELWELKPEGWGYGILPSYSYRRLNIADFSADLPMVNAGDSENIPVVISDPQTNQQVDPSLYTNAYTIVSQATSLLLGITYNSTGGIAYHYKENIAVFDAGLWLSAVEFASNELHYQSRKARKNIWQFANELRFDANFYWVLPALRSGFGVHLQYSHIPSLKLPGSIEFRGQSSYNSEKKVFERRRVFVDHVAVSATSFGLSYSYLFKQAD